MITHIDKFRKKKNVAATVRIKLIRNARDTTVDEDSLQEIIIEIIDRIPLENSHELANKLLT